MDSQCRSAGCCTTMTDDAVHEVWHEAAMGCSSLRAVVAGSGEWVQFILGRGRGFSATWVHAGLQGRILVALLQEETTRGMLLEDDSTRRSLLAALCRRAGLLQSPRVRPDSDG